MSEPQHTSAQACTPHGEDSAATDAERLAAYEAFAAGIRSELDACDVKMESLRTEGKTKTATYRQLFANRATLKEIVRRLDDQGL